MGTPVQRSIRLSPFNASTLDRSSGESGGIIYDQTNQTLRILNGSTNGGTLLATRTWVLNNSSNFDGSYNSLTNKPVLFSGSYNDLTNKPVLFSGNYNDLTNKPTIPSLTGYATETYVNNAVSGISAPDLTNYATKTYVNNAIPSLTGYATETYVNNAIPSLTGYATLNGATFTGDVKITAKTKLGSTTERIVYYDQTVLGDVAHEWDPTVDVGAIIYLGNLSGDPFILNIVGLPLTSFGEAITIAIVIEQSAPIGVLPTIQFDGTDVIYLTPNSSQLIPSDGAVDVMSLTIMPVSNATVGDFAPNIVVFGSLSTYGYF